MRASQPMGRSCGCNSMRSKPLSESSAQFYRNMFKTKCYLKTQSLNELEYVPMYLEINYDIIMSIYLSYQGVFRMTRGILTIPEEPDPGSGSGGTGFTTRDWKRAAANRSTGPGRSYEELREERYLSGQKTTDSVSQFISRSTLVIFPAARMRQVARSRYSNSTKKPGAMIAAGFLK
jgi:hypothetical protein